MELAFWEYYPLPEAERDRIRDEALLIFDTNVLLNLYRYPQSIRQEWTEILDGLSSRLWIPHQVAHEFHKNRLGVAHDRPKVRSALFDEIESARTKLNSSLRTYINLYPERIRHELSTIFSEAFKPITEFFTELEGETPTDLAAHEDPVLGVVSDLYRDRVGPAYDEARINQIYEEGAKRYRKEIPPGYMDSEKATGNPYGDLLIWNQILDKAQEENRPFLFVTTENKADWWWLAPDKKKLGPRVELRREAFDIAGVHFDLLSTSRFLHYARENLDVAISDDAIASAVAAVGQPVHDLLLERRMILPSRSRRVEVLEEVERAWTNGEIEIASDIHRVVSRLGSDVAQNEVRVPLFFALVKNTYGPLDVPDMDLPLRDRPVLTLHDCSESHSFVQHANAAWIAQAFFRIYRQFTGDTAALQNALIELAGEDEDGGTLNMSLDYLLMDDDEEQST